MKTSLILIGNELLYGLIQDKNGLWLSEYLRNKGLELTRTLTVSDNIEEIKNALEFAEKGSDIVLVSGGMGPTEDDLTKYALSEFYSSPIVKRQDAFDLVKSHYERMDKTFDPSKNKYDQMPKDFTLFGNPKGIAPGLFLKRESKKILALPGVPREFQGMIEQYHQELWGDNKRSFEKFLIRTFRIPEEKIFKELDTTLWDRLSKYGNVSSLPHVLGVDIGIDLDNPTDQIKQEIRSLMENSVLKDAIWNFGPESLEEIVISRARQKGITIGFCESCTGGRVAHFTTNLSGCSDVFMGSAVTYSNQAKMNILGVKEQTLIDHGAVSVEVAKEMAAGGVKVIDCDLALSFTGIAGPGGGSKHKPVGTVAIGISNGKQTEGQLYNFLGDRILLKERFMKQGLYNLLKKIESL